MKHEPALCRDGIAESVAHHHRMLAVDRVTELDTVIARWSQLHPASALKYFLTWASVRSNENQSPVCLQEFYRRETDLG